MHDNQTGLRLVGVDFSGQGTLDIDEFDIGSNKNVSVSFNANCCTRKALLSMMDVVGNADRVEFNQGPLNGKEPSLPWPKNTYMYS